MSDLQSPQHQLGDLSRDHLELAAYAGHPPAQAALNEPAQEYPLDEWISGIELWGPEASNRAWVAMTEEIRRTEPSELLKGRQERIETWIACPCDQHWQAIGAGQEGDADALVSTAKNLADLKDENWVRNVVCEELVGWLLGEGDPVKARVAARG